MTETFAALDATLREPDQVDPGGPMSIGGTMVFERSLGGPPSLEALEALLSTRVGALRRYSQRLSSLRAGHFFWPRWEPDPHFEIGHHIRRAVLPAPGTDRELCEWTAEFFSRARDGARPLWELVLLEGLEGGRWALAHKVHHCLVEGAGSFDVLSLLLDDRSDGQTDPAQLARLAELADGSVTSAATASALRFPQVRIRAARAAGRAADTADTAVNVPIGQARRYAVVRAPLAELQAVGRVLGGSFHDVMLAACAGGLRALLVERGEKLSDGCVFAELPVDEASAAARVARIAARTRRVKARRADRAPTTARLAPPFVSGPEPARSTFSTSLFNVTITSVRRSPETLHAFGVPLREVLPIVPPAADQAVGIAVFTYDGMVSVGLNADREAMPDLEVLAAGIDESLAELRCVLPGTPSGADQD